MSSNVLNFPRPIPTPSPRTSKKIYEPTSDSATHRSADLTSQVGITVSQIEHEIATVTTRDRLRRLFL